MQRGILVGLVMLTHALPVFAHAFLESANPPVGSEVGASPSELSLTFSEGIEPLFSTMQSMVRTTR
jgi:methionine-rich copper-binding protein CopC